MAAHYYAWDEDQTYPEIIANNFGGKMPDFMLAAIDDMWNRYSMNYPDMSLKTSVTHLQKQEFTVYPSSAILVYYKNFHVRYLAFPRHVCKSFTKGITRGANLGTNLLRHSLLFVERSH